MTFPENLLKLRTERGLTQADVAKAIDIRTLTYQRYEYGEREPRLSKLIALADFYHLTLDELACRELEK
jgi:transcriptional regulator with XRE-family HTH domain